MNPQAGLLQMIMSLLAGAGFKSVSDGMSKISQAGGAEQLFSLPNMPLFMAGAGLKDAANSMPIVQPLMQMFTPPKPPEQPPPEQVSAAMQMLSARLGPGLSGIQAPGPAPMGGMPGMPGPMPGGPGGMPMGGPPMMSPR